MAYYHINLWPQRCFFCSLDCTFKQKILVEANVFFAGFLENKGCR